MSTILLGAHQLAKSYGSRILFENLSFSIQQGQAIGLVGPNGAGKSTLLKILANLETADQGQIFRSQQLRLAYVAQEPSFAPGQTVISALTEALHDDSDGLKHLHSVAARLSLSLHFEKPIETLSGGWKKRLAIARALVQQPNLLLLDEPTNHLDLQSILWLEDELRRQNQLATLIITHDRQFLETTCRWIYDLDRQNPDGLIRHEGTFERFLELKNQLLSAQRQLEKTQKNTLRRETEWLARGPQARLTKQKARIDNAEALKESVENLERKNRDLRVSFEFGDGGRQPKKLIEAKNISKNFAEKKLFQNFNFILGAHSRIGIVGLNGAGKTTLIRVLMGDLEPDSGTVHRAPQLKVSYFEQFRDQLEPDKTLLQTICPEGDYVIHRGSPVYAKSYLAQFHFTPQQMDLAIKNLSGGERSRLLLARLLLTDAQILVLDEPTNDLDMATLETLRDSLNEFSGAILLVSHDRHFLDSVSEKMLVFGTDGEILEFTGMAQVESWMRAQIIGRKNESSSSVTVKTKKKMGYIERRELEQMESTISTAENEVQVCEQKLASPDVASDFTQLQKLTEELQIRQDKVEKLYQRWQELTDKMAQEE